MNSLDRCLRRATLPVLVLIAGCSTALQPQIFSKHLTASKNVSGEYTLDKNDEPKTFDEVYKEVALVRGRYVSAVSDLSNASPQLSAWLLGLSAAGAAVALGDGSARTVAGIAGVGAASYAAGNLFIVRARIDVYRAGAEALQCGLNAAAPFRNKARLVGEPDDPDYRDTLYGLKAAVARRSDELRVAMRQSQEVDQPELRIVPAQTRSCPRPRPACPAAPAGATAEELKLLNRSACLREQATWDRDCVSTPERTETLPAAPEAIQTMKEARASLEDGNRARRRADRAIDLIEGAASDLWARAVAVQLKVSEEVDRTIPNQTAVLAAIKAAGPVAGALEDGFKRAGVTGASTPASAPGGASATGESQGTARQVRALSAGDRARLRDLAQLTLELQEATSSLDEIAANVAGSGAAKARKAIAACTMKINNTTLRVSPDATSLPLELGKTQPFFVSSTGGVPSADVEVDGKTTSLPVQVQGGQFRVDYTAKDVKAGDTALLTIRDGSAEHAVSLSIIEASGPAPTQTSTAGAARRKPLAIDADTQRKMGLTPPASEAELYAAIDRCQAKGAAPKTGEWDDATQKAAGRGDCKP